MPIDELSNAEIDILQAALAKQNPAFSAMDRKNFIQSFRDLENAGLLSIKATEKDVRVFAPHSKSEPLTITGRIK